MMNDELRLLPLMDDLDTENYLEHINDVPVIRKHRETAVRFPLLQPVGSTVQKQRSAESKLGSVWGVGVKGFGVHFFVMELGCKVYIRKPPVWGLVFGVWCLVCLCEV